ncbi:MAG: hypothetical protein R2729_00485 [Bryobacteraceae bacterium]
MKIVAGAAPRLEPGTVFVRGYFDPLLSAHVEALRRHKTAAPLAVLLEDPEAPLLPRQARAELLAALDLVDYVLLDSNVPGAATAADLCGDDLARRDALIHHVASRHGRL